MKSKIINFLVSTTRQWNPGDEFIMMGVQNLFNDSVFKNFLINWAIYDRNPDLFLNGFKNPVRKGKIWGNSYKAGLDASIFDLAIIAGTPEFFGYPLEEFYITLLKYRIPLVILGVGYVNENIKFSPLEKEVFKNNLIFAVCRDENAGSALRKIGINPIILPCPALFASKKEIPLYQIEKIGFILQTTKTVNQNISSNLFNKCIYLAKKVLNEYSTEFIAFYIDEFIELTKLKLCDVRYSYNSINYLNILKDVDLCISTRLHGAILANSLGKPALLITDNNPRVVSASKLFPYIVTISSDTDFNEIKKILETLKTINYQYIVEWKEKIKQSYLLLINKLISFFKNR